jgi:hypothetical protein
MFSYFVPGGNGIGFRRDAGAFRRESVEGRLEFMLF